MGSKRERFNMTQEEILQATSDVVWHGKYESDIELLGKFVMLSPKKDFIQMVYRKVLVKGVEKNWTRFQYLSFANLWQGSMVNSEKELEEKLTKIKEV